MRQAVAQVIDGLATDPRPPGFLPLTDHRPFLRVRSGDYRLIYAVDDQARTVTVAAVGHRREVYRSLDPCRPSLRVIANPQRGPARGPAVFKTPAVHPLTCPNFRGAEVLRLFSGAGRLRRG